ncbi:uncharacterized protein LOC141602558 [Silene latifolia]|uniref:uncharacterized protein LOC141602558 n=1 Tax=Silene latifolia TaxID=37657 RepID=UPI003D77B580
MRRTPTEDIELDSSDATSGDPASVFGITKVNDTTIALRNMLHGVFCQRFPKSFTPIMNDTLRAIADSSVKEAQFLVEEPVIDRTVKIEYRLQHARIYDNQPKSWLSTEVTNTTPEAGSFSLETKYVESYSHTLHVTATLSTNITTKFSAGIPLVVESEVEVEIGASIETGYEHTWDKTTEHSASVTVVIPAGKKRAARMLAMNAKCDVPFFYVQTDILANNERIETVLEDGVFKGINGYHFVIEIFDPENNPSVALETRNWKPITLPDLVQGGSLRKRLAGGQGFD